MEASFAKLWADKFPKEPLPNIFSKTNNPHELIGLYDCKINELQKSLEQCLFIKKYLIDNIKSPKVLVGKLPASKLGGKSRSQSEIELIKSAKHRVEVNGSVNKFINQYKTVVVHTSVTDCDPKVNTLTYYTARKGPGTKHTATDKEQPDRNLRGYYADSNQPIVINKPPAERGLIERDRCVSLTDIFHSDCSNSVVGLRTSPDRPPTIERSRFSDRDSSDDVFDAVRARCSINKYNTKKCNTMAGESMRDRSEFYKGTSFDDSSKPVPVPRKNKSPSLRDRASSRSQDNIAEVSGIKDSISKEPFVHKDSSVRDMAVECAELPSVHSRIHNFEQKFTHSSNKSNIFIYDGRADNSVTDFSAFPGCDTDIGSSACKSNSLKLRLSRCRNVTDRDTRNKKSISDPLDSESLPLYEAIEKSSKIDVSGMACDNKLNNLGNNSKVHLSDKPARHERNDYVNVSLPSFITDKPESVESAKYYRNISHQEDSHSSAENFDIIMHQSTPKRLTDNLSDPENSDCSEGQINSFEGRPRNGSNSSEAEISSLDEVSLDGISLTKALTDVRGSVEQIDMRHQRLSDMAYESFDFDPSICTSLNITDDDKTMAIGEKDEDADSGLSLDRSHSFIETPDVAIPNIVIETDIDDPVASETQKDTQLNRTVIKENLTRTKEKVAQLSTLFDQKHNEVEKIPLGPEASTKNSRSRRVRHDYEEIKEFMIPVIDAPSVAMEKPCEEESAPSSIADGKQRFRKRVAPKPVAKLLLPQRVSGDRDSSDSEEAEIPIPKTPEDKSMHQRYVVIKGILDSEEDYLTCLDVIIQYMKSLEGASKSSLSQLAPRQSALILESPYISSDEVHEIFYNINKIYDIHRKFVVNLRERVQNWSRIQCVGDLFKLLIMRFPDFSDYIHHYQRSVDTILQCSIVNRAFGELVKSIKVPNCKEILSLQEILFKPVQRIQRNTLVLHDLMRCTPSDHPDYYELESTLRLSQHNLGEFGTSQESTARNSEERRLLHNGFAVELVGDSRKLRYIFLFSDVIVCTKRKLSSRHKCSFDIKWFIPLHKLSIDRCLDPETQTQELANVDELKRKVSQMKAEIRREIKYEKSSQKRWLNSGQRSIDKLKRKLEEQEAELVLASPNLPFRLLHEDHKSFTLLMSTDYEREEWIEAVTQQMQKWHGEKTPSTLEIHNFIEQVKQLPKVNNIGSVLLKIGSDDDVWNGVLNVTIKQLSGLKEPADTYCCLELDSYGHFFMKAKTKLCCATTEPFWGEDFEVDLDGSQTLRILCYRLSKDGSSAIVIGRSRLELNKSWLTDRFQDMEIPMNETSLSISIKHTSAAKTMKRQASRLKNGVFGVKIATVAKREHREVPIIVTSCVEEIERRGMEEVGIYRVSGVTSDVQKLKKLFEKNSRAAATCLDQCDIHAVTGILKLYFRELPDPLFTTSQYAHFVTTMELKDPEAKQRCMISLLQELPDHNLATIYYLLNHLIRVSQYESSHRMSCNNLATIFGPGLLRPASKDVDPTQSVAQQVFAGAQEAYVQTSILLYFLKLLVDGIDITRVS